MESVLYIHENYILAYLKLTQYVTLAYLHHCRSIHRFRGGVNLRLQVRPWTWRGANRLRLPSAKLSPLHELSRTRTKPLCWVYLSHFIQHNMSPTQTNRIRKNKKKNNFHIFLQARYFFNSQGVTFFIALPFFVWILPESNQNTNENETKKRENIFF